MASSIRNVCPYLGVVVCLGMSAFSCSSGRAGESGKQMAMNREVKASIDLAQQWLAKQQRSDGVFYGDHGAEPGVIAAGVLAWMASGNLPGEGRWEVQVSRGVEAILKTAQPSGLLRGQQYQMYNHALATICLAEVWGQTQDKQVYETLKKAVGLIVRSQNDRGGWHYSPRPVDDDLSVTTMQMVALCAARQAEIPVPDDVMKLALKYVRTCRNPKDNDGLAGFSYKPGEGKLWSTTAAGVVALMMGGGVHPEEFKHEFDYLIDASRKRKDERHFLSGHLYSALAFYRASRQNEAFSAKWQAWYTDISKRLIALQYKQGRERGSVMQPDSEYGIWSTATAVLILGMPYRYLPVYQP